MLSAAADKKRTPTAAICEQDLVLQELIWANAVTATEVPGKHRDAVKLLLPALNNTLGVIKAREAKN